MGKEKGKSFQQPVKGKLPDPYMLKWGWPEPTVCPSCQAIYRKKRWAFDEKQLQQIKKAGKAESHKCPACRKIEDHFAMGHVIIKGDFSTDHREEIINMIKNEEARAKEKNPLERLMGISKQDDGIHVETTSDSLALRIGRLLSRAFKGSSEFKFRYGDKTVTVEWTRWEGKK